MSWHELLTAQGVRQSAALVVWLLVSLFGSNAQAWQRTLTCDDDMELSMVPCGDRFNARALFWADACLYLYVDDQLSRRFTPEDQPVEAIMSAAEEWSAVECSEIAVQVAGLSDEDRVGFSNCGGPPSANANVLMFRDEGWTHGRMVVALTSVTYDLRDGQIYDADVEINTQDFDFSALPEPETRGLAFDLQNVATHEIGHLLGFDHTTPDNIVEGLAADARRTVMHFEARPGEVTKRDLHANDRASLCQVYPEGAALNDTCSTPPAGYYDAPSVGPTDACPSAARSCAAAESRGAPSAGIVLVLLSLFYRRRSQL